MLYVSKKIQKIIKRLPVAFKNGFLQWLLIANHSIPGFLMNKRQGKVQDIFQLSLGL